jgi:hypothetical protein
MILTRAANGVGTPSATSMLYVGAYSSLMAPATDPLPLIILGTNTNSSPFPGGGATRAPTMTPATAYPDVFTVANGSAGSTLQIGATASWADVSLNFGTLGNAADTNWFKNLGGPVTSRLLVFPGCLTSGNSARGILRGYLQNVWGAVLATHSYGDTFMADGKVCAGIGATSPGQIFNTEAA